ncbi:placenta-specific gene 8 protein-like [Pomacea canaliculata]|uniref:placenta-specific gene 8 protein-like n=1 Tax=Pomacea canaliculata TaxID=400727 RepID=UPI000D727952|nr:placenta-specific gene 8 protein-like [Pomacea canaliculata]
MEGPEVVNQQQAYSTPQYGGPPPQWGYQPPVVTQPQMSNTNNTTVVINQQSAGPAYKPPRAWSTGICGCFDDLGVCCCVWWCTPCAISQLVGDMGEHCCVPCCVPGWLVALRTKLRTQHNIQGGVMSDCCAAYYCYYCVLCQMMREVKLTRGLSP